LQIVSYNLHGLNQGRSLLTELCNSSAQIIFIQQHWQTPSSIDKILCFSQNSVGFGIFAMERVVTLSILKCWPHGGVAILINKSLGKLCKIRLILAKEKAVIISLDNTVYVNLYFSPALPSTAAVVETMLDEICGVLNSYQSASLVFGGNINTNIPARSKVSA